MAYPWVKLWTEFVHDPKMLLLPEHLQLVYVKLLCICGEYDQERKGWLPAPKRLAVTLRSTPEQVLADLSALAETDPDDPDDEPLVVLCDGHWMITKFEARQGAMNSTARSTAMRGKKHKESYYTGGDATDMQRNVAPDATNSCTDIDIDIDTDTDKETGAANAARAHDVIPFTDDAPDEEPEPAQRKRAKPRPDARTGHPAIQAIRHVSGRLPAKAQYDVLIRAIGDAPPDEALLKRCYDAWVLKGWNPGNLAWATEWYAQGGPPQTHKQSVVAAANGATEHSIDEWAAIAAQFNGGRT